jgi:hypothetical protein
VPIVLGVVALVMLAMGWNLERVSLGSLIIALGLLVDDGIIAVEMMVGEDGGGLGPRQGGRLLLRVDRDAAPDRCAHHRRRVHADRLSKSTTGEYAGGIFWIVGTAVVFSWFVSGVITPYLAVKMLPDLKKHAGGDSYHTPFYKKLRGWIDSAIARRWWVIGATGAAFVLAVFGSRLVPQQFFPNSDRPELVVELRLKEGSSFAATTEQVKKMEAVLAKDEDVKFYTAYTGAGQPRFYLSLDPELPNPGYAVFVVMTKGVEARERVRSRLMAGANEQFPNVWVRVTRLELGPPVGFPVQFRVVGPDTLKVREIARQVEAVVAASPKVRDVQLDWNDPVRTLRVDIDQEKARTLGLAPADISFVTQTFMNGATLSQLRQHEDLVDIVAAAVPSERLNVETLKDVNLYTREGTVVPLSQVARIGYELEEPVLWRRNRDMAITVRADVKDGEQAVSATQSIVPQLKDIQASCRRAIASTSAARSRKAPRPTTRWPPSSGDAGDDPDHPHAAAAELLEDVHGAAHRAARPDRRRRRAARLPGAARLRGHPRHHGAERDDHAQLGDPHRPGARGDGAGPRSVECGARSCRPPDPARDAHGRGHRARHGPAHAQHLLGPDGDRDHGRPERRHGADDLLRAGALRGVVPDRAPAGGRTGAGRRRTGARILMPCTERGQDRCDGTVFRIDADELVLAMPAEGVAADCLARPLSELGLPPGTARHVLRVEAPPRGAGPPPTPRSSRRWSANSTAQARVLDVRGVPKELRSLLDLSRAGPATVEPVGPRFDIRARVGALALAAVADARLFIELLGQVVLLLPRYAAGRARIRRADISEMLADCGHRALPIVAIVNLLMGGILAFVGAVELEDFGAGIYVANLVGIASVRELTPILNAIVLAGRTGASFAATIATMQATRRSTP